MALFVNAEHFLNLRLGLQHEILRAASTQNHHAASASIAFGIEHDRRCLVHVLVGIEHQLVTVQREGGDVHPDRAVARR